MMQKNIALEVDIAGLADDLPRMVKEELAKLVKTEKFRAYLQALLFYEMKQELGSKNLLNYISQEDREYIYKKAIAKLCEEGR